MLAPSAAAVVATSRPRPVPTPVITIVFPASGPVEFVMAGTVAARSLSG